MFTPPPTNLLFPYSTLAPTWAFYNGAHCRERLRGATTGKEPTSLEQWIDTYRSQFKK